MNPVHPTTPADPSALRDGCSEKFAIHFHMPDTDAIRTFFHADDPLVLMQMAVGFHVLLTEGLGVQMPEIGAAGSLVEGMFIFNAPHRARVIELALKFFKYQLGSIEIARYHAAELQWITVHPAGCALPFDRWLTDERHEARVRVTEPLIEQFELLRARLFGGAGNPPPLAGDAPQT